MQRIPFHRLLQISAALVWLTPVFGQTGADLPELSNVQRELKGGETHSYRIKLAAGQFLHAAVVQENIDLITATFAPDGTSLTVSDSPNDWWGPEPVLLVASVGGEYRVDVRSPNSKASPGHYRIEIVALRDATPKDMDHAAAQLMFDEARKLRAEQSAAARRAAIEKYVEALRLFEVAGDTYRRALTFQSLGVTYYLMSEFRQALEYFDKTLELSVALGDRRIQAGTETWIGGMLDILGDVGKALDHHQRALQLAREGRWQLTEGNALSNIGKIYSDGSEWQKALEFYGKALSVFRALRSKQNEAVTLNNIGIVFSRTGERQKALQYLQEALPLLRASGNKNAEAYTLLNIGRVYSRLGENKNALDYYKQAQVLQRDTANRANEAETLSEIGAVISDEGRHQEALEYHLQAVQILRSVGNLRREAISLTSVGEVYNLMDQPEKALEHFTPALPVFRSIGDLGNAATSLAGIAKAEQKRGNLEDAHKHIVEAIALIETVRSRSSSWQLRTSYRATVETAYEFYIDVLMQRHAKNPSGGYDAEALKANERARARSLLEQLSEAPIDIREGVDSTLIEKERELTRVLNAKAQREMQLKARKGSNEHILALQKEISALEDEYQQVQAAIRKSSPQYAALTQPQPLGLKEIQQQLDRDTVLLEYSLGDTRSYLWAVTPTSLRTYELPKREEIQKIAEKAYELLVARSVVKSLETPEARRSRIAKADAQFTKTASELSRMILAPVAADLKGRRLVIVADGALQYVPFAALSVSAGPSFRPLIADHEIISLQSASAFALQRQNLADRQPAPRAVAVIADPVFSPSDVRLKATGETKVQTSTRVLEHQPGNAGGHLSIPRLPYTRWEANQIIAVAPAGSSMKALGFQANRALASSEELSKYRYVHFATHGYLDADRAGLSAIVLSMVDEEGKPQDGFLRTHDIYNLKLPAELVVLSACETGLGKDVEGEGLEGLTRAFMYAGARRVVVSLWNVNDRATAALMQRLYAGMLRSNKTPAAALRAAQIEMMRNRQWQSPYFWAAFVMQGEWK